MYVYLCEIEDDQNFADRTGLTKGKWYKVEVGQEYQQQKSGYVYYITINGQRVHEALNKNATEFNNMNVYASDPWHSQNEDTRVRSFFKFGNF